MDALPAIPVVYVKCETGGHADFSLPWFVPIEALKESFVKAIGTGLGFNLQRLEFHLSSEALTQDRVLRETQMYLDEEEQTDWTFEVSPSEEAGDGLEGSVLRLSEAHWSCTHIRYFRLSLKLDDWQQFVHYSRL